MVSALLLPLYDVIRVAEDLAVLDLASSGRIDLVIGGAVVRSGDLLIDGSLASKLERLGTDLTTG